MRFQRVDGLQLVLAPVESKLTRVVGRCDCRRVGQVQRCQPRSKRTPGSWREPIHKGARIYDGMTDRKERSSARVAEDERVVVAVRVQEIAAVCPPARRVAIQAADTPGGNSRASG